MNSFTNFKSTSRCDFENDRKRFGRDFYARCFSGKDLFIIDLLFVYFGFCQPFLVTHFLPKHTKLVWKLSSGRVRENRTVDSAAFHKERLFRCVDDITFLPVGPRYIVNIRVGSAHFSDKILRKNHHFDVIHVCNSTYWQQQRCSIRG